MTSKCISVGVLLTAETLAMSLWFASAAVLPEMVREVDLTPARQALMTSAVQAGFVVGALAIAISGIADRLDPRRVFSVSALAAAAANASLLAVPVGSGSAVLLRAATGLLLAGVYPVGMKVIVGWGVRDRSLLVSLLVGALTLGSAMPHLLSLYSGVDWRFTIIATSLCGSIAGLLVLAMGLGPHHAKTPKFDPAAIRVAWTDPGIRLAYLGYLGHMWELYAMWASVTVAARASYLASLPPATATWLAKITAFLAIALGAVACGIAGALGDRVGGARVASVAMSVSACAALATAASFGGPAWLTMVLIVIWGITIIPDSAQFSALVADVGPKHLTGSLLALQTALGFGLTILTVQATPLVVATIGWRGLMIVLALGPALGIRAMLSFERTGART
jgi:MFS family permease